MNGAHLLALATAVLLALALTAIARRISARHHHAAYQAAVADNLLLLARDNAATARADRDRAIEHADDAQAFLTSVIGHPVLATAERLTLIPGGAR